MKDRIDPRYAKLVPVWREAQQTAHGFITLSRTG
ncbi:hypothetical protein HEP81_06546 [Streptomyces griseofuscus]|uniref:Uncharacterized protein n=1 Tax=Streptomyces griseofuscus TaxID=146922 RepID=A0A7H1Q901_9ACTN|nr:hypothetical protein HEP81_06546 [Streptomyces griseofuscus]